MPKATGLASADAVVLCGGKGERLREVVSDRPKPLAEIGGRPFLDLLLDWAAGYGLRRFVLCAGYKAEQIRERYAKEAPKGSSVVVSCEPEPLGTAGALRHGAELIQSPAFLVLNGDSICRADLSAFWAFHAGHGGAASVVLAPPESEKDYGVVSMDASGRISTFAEKAGAGTGQRINAGIYIFSKSVLDGIPSGRKVSLETDVLPGLARQGQAWGFPVDARVIDIGTPVRYEAARRALGAKP
ncbi:MAG: nucleotidyltransferase family protein [Elusimicrobia bacterium]|nr:nucleotidyltransferase family protein [Elusimicrobiota bacterium]